MLKWAAALLLLSRAAAQVCFDDYGSGFANASQTFLSKPLMSNDNQAKQRFGKALDINGNRAVVCAYLTDSALIDTGKCYVFVKSGSSWDQVQSFYGPNPGASDYFGYSVDMDGNWLIVGAPQDRIGSTNYAGSATLYYWNGAAYVSPITITRPVPTALDMCGTAVGIQNATYALMGCIGDDTVASDGGLVYVFKLNGAGSVTYNGTLTAPNGANDNFGSAIAIEGGTVVVGAAAYDGVGSNSGKGYLYDLTNGIQTLRYSFIPTPLLAGDQFGTAVSVSHPYILVGAPYYDGSFSNMGAAYLFYDTGSAVVQLARITDAVSPFTNAYFGSSVAIYRASPVRLELLIGEYNGRAYGSNNPTGTAQLYLYDITTGQTRFVTEFLSSTGRTGDYFGGAVAVSGRTFLIGSERQNTESGGSSTGAGTAYIYTLASCTNQSGICYTVSFDVDAVGVPLSTGTLITTQYSSLSMTIVNTDPTHPAILFDSSSPTCVGGTNIATPNVAYNGTGTGSGGTLTNSMDIDKMIVLQNQIGGCTPEVANQSLSFLFNFTSVINPSLISFVDGRTSGSVATDISFYSDYAMGNLLGTTVLPYIGTDSVQTLSLSLYTSTRVMKISLGGPAGIASFTFCMGNASVCFYSFSISLSKFCPGICPSCGSSTGSGSLCPFSSTPAKSQTSSSAESIATSCSRAKSITTTKSCASATSKSSLGTESVATTSAITTSKSNAFAATKPTTSSESCTIAKSRTGTFTATEPSTTAKSGTINQSHIITKHIKCGKFSGIFTFTAFISKSRTVAESGTCAKSCTITTSESSTFTIAKSRTFTTSKSSTFTIAKSKSCSRTLAQSSTFPRTPSLTCPNAGAGVSVFFFCNLTFPANDTNNHNDCTDANTNTHSSTAVAELSSMRYRMRNTCH